MRGSQANGLIAIAIFVATALMTACGGGPETTPDPTPVPTPEPKPSEPAVATPSPAANTDVEDDHGDSADAASPAHVGEPLPGTIGHPGDVDLFAFDARQGEIYQIDIVLGTLSDSQLGLLDGEGWRTVAYNDDLGDSQASRILWWAQVEGTTFVRVKGAGSEIGTYTLTVSAYEDDHGNRSADASRAPMGEPVPGTIEYLEDLEWCDRDFFRFDALEGGTFRIDLTPGTLDGAWIDLYDSQEWLAWNAAPLLAPDGLRIFWRARDTGALFVQVRGCGAVTGSVARAFPGGDDIMLGAAGTYSLTVSTTDIEDDHANSVVDASPAPIGEPVPGTIEYEGDEDLFAFEVMRGELYRIEVVLGTLPHAWTALYHRGAWEWQRDWDHGGPSLPGTSLESRTWRAQRTGKAVVSVGGFYVTDTGTYALTVSALGDEDDHANYLTGASPAPTGESVGGTLEHGDDVDFFAFDVLEGRTYQIDVAAPRTRLDLRIELFGADGGRVVAQDDQVRDYHGPYHSTSRIVWRAPSTATISVGVSGIEPWDAGAYTLTIADYADDHGNDLSSASPVPLGRSVHGSIHQEGDVDLFAFDAREGVTYLVDADLGTIRDLQLTLRDEDGDYIAFNDQRWTYYQPVRIAWQGRLSGRLFAEVGGYQGLGTGTYTLTVSVHEDDHGNRPAIASRVPVGESVTGSIEYTFDLDFFAFDARKGEAYQIDVTPGTLTEPEATLSGEDGEHIDSDYGRGGSPAARIVWRALRTGSLFLQVNGDHGFHPPDAGTYTLTISVLDIEDDGG